MNKVWKFIAAGILLSLLVIGTVFMRLILVPFIWVEVGTIKTAIQRFKFEGEMRRITKKIHEERAEAAQANESQEAIEKLKKKGWKVKTGNDDERN